MAPRKIIRLIGRFEDWPAHLEGEPDAIFEIFAPAKFEAQFLLARPAMESTSGPRIELPPHCGSLVLEQWPWDVVEGEPRRRAVVACDDLEFERLARAYSTQTTAPRLAVAFVESPSAWPTNGEPLIRAVTIKVDAP